MAEQKGSIKYVGTLGAIRHYQYNGLPGFYAGLKGGPTAKMVKHHPNFVRTRENNKEFGGCAQFGKSIRHSFGNLMKRLGDGGLAARLVKISKSLNLDDTSSVRGQRHILLSNKKSILTNFELNIDNPLETSVKLAYHLNSYDGRTIELTTTPFYPNVTLNIPKSATHFRFVIGIGFVCDYKYDAISDSYLANNPDESLKPSISYSEYLSVTDVIMPVAISAHTNFLELSSSTSVLHVMGIEFYASMGTRWEPIKSGGVLKIVYVG